MTNKKKKSEEKKKTRAVKIQKAQDPWEILLTAVYSSDIETLKQLAANGFDLNGYNEFGYFPLYWAAQDPDLMKWMIEQGVNVNAGVKNDEQQGMTCLMDLAGSEEVDNRPEKMKLLVDAGADLNARDARGKTALHHAVKGSSAQPVCSVESAKTLLELGADPHIGDRDGYTPLFYAEAERILAWEWMKESGIVERAETIRDLLLAAGARPQNTDLLSLYKAVEDQDMEKIRSLIEQGVDSNRIWNEQSCLAEACRKGNAEIVDLLLTAGADPNRVRMNNASALIEAAREGHLEIVRRLIAAGADPDYEEEGINAEAYARQNEYTDVVDYLCQHARLRGTTRKSFGEGQGVMSYDLNETALVVKAGIDAVAELFKEAIGASVHEKDVQRKKVMVTEECCYIMQFAGRRWTNIYEIKSRSGQGLSMQLAKELSAKSPVSVLWYANSDTSGAVEYCLFEQGTAAEQVVSDPEGWEPYGKKKKKKTDDLIVTSRSGTISADSVKNVYDFIRRRMKEMEILIPGFGSSMAPVGSEICFFESMAKEDFVRVDFIGL